MRTLRRNKQTLWYANPTGTQYVTNSDGFKTGDKKNTYGTPEEIRMSMTFAANIGSEGHATNAVLDPQGIVTGYAWTAVTDDLNCPITEESILWYSKEPKDAKGNALPHNLVVIRKVKSLNSVTYYLKEADVG